MTTACNCPRSRSSRLCGGRNECLGEFSRRMSVKRYIVISGPLTATGMNGSSPCLQIGKMCRRSINGDYVVNRGILYGPGQTQVRGWGFIAFAWLGDYYIFRSSAMILGIITCGLDVVHLSPLTITVPCQMKNKKKPLP